MGQPFTLAPVSAIERVEMTTRGQVVLVDPAAGACSRHAAPGADAGGAFLPQSRAAVTRPSTFTAGFGPQWSDVPADLAQAVLMLAARYHEDRSFEGSHSAMPFGVSVDRALARGPGAWGRGTSRGRA